MSALIQRLRMGLGADAVLVLVLLTLLVVGMRQWPPPALAAWPGTVALQLQAGAGGAQPLPQIPADVLAGRFEPQSPGGVAVPGGSVAWLRLAVAQAWASDDLPILVLRNVGTRSAALYQGGRLVGVADPAQDQGTGRHRNRTAYFRLPIGLDPGTALDVRIGVGMGADVRPALEAGEQVQAARLGAAHAYMLIIGMLLTMLVASLLLGVTNRESRFFIFTGYTAAQILYVGLSSGEAFEWPLFDLLRAHANQVRTLAVVAGALGVQLFLAPTLREVLPQRGPALILKAFNVVLAGIGLAALVPSPSAWLVVAGAGNIVVLLWSAFSLVLVVAAARRGSRFARLILVGWGPMWLSTVARADQFLRGAYSPVLDVVFPAAIAAASVSMAFAIGDQWRRQRRELDLTRHAAETDGLTRVLNRRAIEARLRALCHPKRQQQGLALLFIDLDHFKLINDRYGHAAGDACLQGIVEPVRQELRTSDSLGRWGGEEFVVLLPGASLASACQVAERIRSRLKTLRIPTGGNVLGLTTSIGVAALGPTVPDADALINAADTAAYLAKQRGRDRVEPAPAADAPVLSPGDHHERNEAART